VLAGHPFAATITGDASLRARPMARVARPLELMGAAVRLSAGGRLPMTVTGGALRGIEYTTEVPSAQVKSAVLLAGLLAEGWTRVREPAQTRDHTERALERFGAGVERSPLAALVRGGGRLEPVEVEVPGDISSAAFWAAAAAGVPGGVIEVEGVGLNPTRTAVLDVLRRAGVDVSVEEQDPPATRWEPVGRLRVRHAGPVHLSIAPAEVPGLIDELPALAALATFGGSIEVSGAAELRVKESDRITSLVAGLGALGADARERPDGFVVDGSRRPGGGIADAAGDHRLAMAFAVAALGAKGPSLIRGAEAVEVSYPGFFAALATLADGQP
jgi:3-phosphoshikimate 1-carboxyvinyltransferase